MIKLILPITLFLLAGCQTSSMDLLPAPEVHSQTTSEVKVAEEPRKLDVVHPDQFLGTTAPAGLDARPFQEELSNIATAESIRIVQERIAEEKRLAEEQRIKEEKVEVAQKETTTSSKTKSTPKETSTPKPTQKPKPESKPKAESKPKPAPAPAQKPATSAPAAKPAPKAEPKPEPKPAPKPAPKPQPKPAPKPQPKPEPKPEPKPNGGHGEYPNAVSDAELNAFASEIKNNSYPYAAVYHAVGDTAEHDRYGDVIIGMWTGMSDQVTHVDDVAWGLQILKDYLSSKGYRYNYQGGQQRFELYVYLK